MTDAKAILEGLSEAQKRAVLATRGPDADGLYWFALGSARGLPDGMKQRTVVGHCLTPLGLQVRALKEESANKTPLNEEQG